METRQNTIPITATEIPTPLKLEGYAVVFDTPAQVGDYEEMIQRGALADCDMSDVALIYNHDLNKIPLARVPNTLTLEVDQRGLKFSAVLPNTEEGKAVYESVKRGDLRGCSFAFTIASGGADVNQQTRTRNITKIDKIFELSICPFPAYDETSVTARTKNLKGNDKMTDTTNTTNENATENQKQFGNNAQMLLRNVAGLDAVENVKQFDSETVLETAEYRNAFYKQLQGKDLTAAENTALKVAKDNFNKRANEFNTATNSAAVIPTDTLNEIIRKARTQGGLMAECRGFSIPANVSIPIATPKDRASWHTEGAAVESEKIDTTSVTFSNNEILKVFSLSLKAQAMTISAFESYLTDELQSCVMETLEYTLVNGTGSGQGTGIMSVFDSDNTIIQTSTGVVNGVSDTTYAQPISYDLLVNTIAKLHAGYRNGAKFAMNSTTLYNRMYRMKDNDGRPLFIQDLQNGGIGKILGFDIVIDDYLPNDVVIFGNFKYMSYNLPQGIIIESSRESSFKSGLIDYRALAIADCKPLLKDAFVMLTDDLTYLPS